jgi:hypothetical protein
MLTSLPIAENPSLKELHTSAFPLSILEAYDGFSEEYLLQNYIPVAFKKLYGNVLTYDRPFFWRWDCFEWRISLHYPRKNVLKKIIDYIENGYYVFLCVNEYYIPERHSYQNKYFNHEILIFGFNESENFFQTIAYDINGEYKTQKISFSDIDKAFRSNNEHFYKFFALKVRSSYNFHQITTKTLKKKLSRYLNTHNPRKGKNSYDALILLIVKSSGKIDMRSFRTLMERSALLLKSTTILSVPKDTSHLLRQNKRLGVLLFNQALKYNLTNNQSLKERIIQTLLEYARAETKIISTLVDVI